MRTGLSLACCLIVAVGCGAESQAPTYHQQVKPLIDAYCKSCHSAGGIAPYSFETYAGVKALENPIAAAVTDRRMPPFLAERGHTALANDTTLSDEQIATIVDWVAAGAPEGDATRPGEPIVLPRQGLDGYDLELKLPLAYEPKLAPDEYRCFVFDWPSSESKFVTGVEVVPGNKLIAHHAALYVVGPAQAARAKQFDDEDPGPGYSCFGGAEKTGFEAQGLTDRFVYGYLGAWVPGASAHRFDNGARVEPGSKLVLQMHYFTDGNLGEVDKTTVRIATADKVEREAFFMPWMSFKWPIGLMHIPANQEARFTYRDKPLTSINVGLFAGDQDFSKGMVLHSTLLHMHKLGKSISLTLHRKDGSEQVLVNVPRWDFDWQREYIFKSPVQVYPGDELQVQCVFDNTDAANYKLGRDKGASTSNWGEGTNDEMCVAHTRITHP
ncbi:MAG: hypothetical protein KC503_18095 [Myxococcales bacterium]|nr:hypothetical protein [Myxococcales bacterium]